MNVILVNGSPKEKGCTYTGLSVVAQALEHQRIDTQIFQLGQQALAGCKSCYYCTKNDGCIIDDCVNEFITMANDADGFIFGSPVHYAAAGGTITSFMDRVFFASKTDVFRGKPAAAMVSCRRAGSTAALDQLNKYFTISQMPIVSSRYWNMVHGSVPQDVLKDAEGIQVMQILGENMAWLLHCIAAGKAAGIALPPTQKPVRTNYIR